MVKFHYFETLEHLCTLAESAVRLACGEGGNEKTAMSDLRRACDRAVCELEDALFSDFLPPLERDNVAACAHCLSRVVDQAGELYAHRGLYATGVKNEEGAVCIRLSENLTQSVSLLRRIRKPDETPDLTGYRTLLAEGRMSHTATLRRLHTGALPHSYAQTVILTGRLRAELSRSFDELVEIMLNNI